MIPVRNVYYMLAYAFSALRSEGLNSLDVEEFENTAELLAAILARGINLQVKRGLVRAYAPRFETTSFPHGKIDITGSINEATFADHKLICSYDEFTTDAYLNRILKTAGRFLLKTDIDPARKRGLRRALAYLDDVESLDPNKIEWRQRFDRGTQTYQMLINVCRLIVTGCLQSTASGEFRLEEFVDDGQMSKLYERFILEYFRQEHSDEASAEAPYIPWVLDDGYGEMLPIMHTDVTLRGRGNASDRTLIIDAKYYGHNTQSRFNRNTIHSGNLYQIFSYVKNEDERLSRLDIEHEVSGMLLYAKTDEDVQPDGIYSMSGNEIAVKTLDLNCDFSEIKSQLDSVVENYFVSI